MVKRYRAIMMRFKLEEIANLGGIVAYQNKNHSGMGEKLSFSFLVSSGQGRSF